MSRFIDNVQAQFTGQKRVKKTPLSVSIEDVSVIEMPVLQKEYEIGVTYKRRIWCEHKDLPRMMDNLIRDLRHEIYADIKNRVSRLERAVYANDEEKIMPEIRDIIREVFGII
jgi:hypothetical protein